jgi:hypothetical protein
MHVSSTSGRTYNLTKFTSVKNMVRGDANRRTEAVPCSADSGGTVTCQWSLMYQDERECSLRQHTQATRRLGEVTTGYDSGGFVADSELYIHQHTRYKDKQETTHLEASGTPINKLDCTLRFNAGNCCRRVLGHNVATVKQAHGHYHIFRSWINHKLESHALYFPSFGSHFTYPRYIQQKARRGIGRRCTI